MRHRAVGVEAGDGREGQADETRTSGALGAQALVDGELGDRFAAGHRRLEPGVEGAHRRAVLLHRLADELRLGGVLAALEQRAGVDGLDDGGGRGQRLAQAQGHASRIDQHPGISGQGAERGARVGIRGDAHAIGGQALRERGVDLAGLHEQGRAVGVEQRVCQEHRVVADVRAAQVEQPGDVVDAGDQVVGDAVPRHRLADLPELVGAADGGLRRGVLVDRGVGQAGALVPGVVDQVERGVDAHALGAHRRAQLLRERQSQHLAVDDQRLARLQAFRQPADVLHRCAGGNLEERDAAAGKFTLGLRPVAAVGEELRVVERDDQRAHRAGEAGEHLARLPAARQVFGEMGVGRGDQDGVGAGVAQRVAQSGDAQLDLGKAGVHGGPRRVDGHEARRPGEPRAEAADCRSGAPMTSFRWRGGGALRVPCAAPRARGTTPRPASCAGS